MLKKFLCIKDYDSVETDLETQEIDFKKGKIYFAEKEGSSYTMYDSENKETLYMDSEDMKYFKPIQKKAKLIEKAENWIKSLKGGIFEIHSKLSEKEMIQIGENVLTIENFRAGRKCK
jgi:hypothetical protein